MFSLLFGMSYRVLILLAQAMIRNEMLVDVNFKIPKILMTTFVMENT